MSASAAVDLKTGSGSVNVNGTDVGFNLSEILPFSKKDLVSGSAGLFALYLGIFAGGNIGRAISCQTKKYLETHYAATHVIAFMAILFFSSLVSKTGTPAELLNQVFAAIGVYGAFVVSTKMQAGAFAVFLGIIATIYMLKRYMDVETNEENHNYAMNVQLVLIVFGVFVLAYGAAAYYGEKRVEYYDIGGKWSWTNYILGTGSCNSAKDDSDITKDMNMNDKISRAFGVYTENTKNIIAANKNKNSQGGYY